MWTAKFEITGKHPEKTKLQENTPKKRNYKKTTRKKRNYRKTPEKHAKSAKYSNLLSTENQNNTPT